MATYVIDTSSLVEASDHIPKDIFKEFWKKLEESFSKEDVISVRAVLKEIEEKEDTVKEIAIRYKHIFQEPTEKEVEHVKELSQKKLVKDMIKHESKTTKDTKIDADIFLMAKAQEKNCVL